MSRYSGVETLRVHVFYPQIVASIEDGPHPGDDVIRPLKPVVIRIDKQDLRALPGTRDVRKQ